ncbi:MAG: MmcQ/YjbR family DNA-binding protein, partial [Candidatus Cloacimonetes bacterium]|nr:MmcQ/YjbR family DNA-binding protein [Candidatus Cloacimonadota bacterium]
MKVDYIREYCLRKPGVTEDLPFDENTLVMKVGSKMFALFGNE